MSEKDKAEIMEALSSLPDDQKLFMLGYVAGVTAKAEAEAKGDEKHDARADQEQ